MDVAIDEQWIDPLVAFLKESTTATGERETSVVLGQGVTTYEHVARTPSQPIVQGYEYPPLPSVVQVEKMHISGIELTMWCSLKLGSDCVRFLPSYVKAA